jgi:hypothetical protein
VINAFGFAFKTGCDGSWSVMFEGSGMKEISLPSRWWCSSWSVSAGMFLLGLFYGGIVSCFSAETRWAPMLGVSECPDRSPEHEREKRSRSSTLVTLEEIRNLLKTAQSSKVVNPFTHALTPPFIGRRTYFYIMKTPSSLKNIPSVNMYMNVFYISYIYKPATSSHTKPGHFEMTYLTWLLTDSWISPLRKSSYAATSELELQQTPEFRRLLISWFCRFMTPGLHKFATLGASQVQDFRSSKVRNFGASHVRDSGSSQV